MKVIIAGGRDFDNYTIMYNAIEELQKEIEITRVVCGGARGADLMGAQIATTLNIPVDYFFADWDTYGKAAGIIRNHQMGDYADYLLAFWDGKSKGTKDMINYMKQLGKHGKVVRYEIK